MDILPMFPLAIVVFPGEKVNLHIFEKRYRQLMHEAEEFDITFGIPLFATNTLINLAPELKLDKVVKRYNDGKLDVTVEAIGLLQVSNFQKQHASKLYPIADVERIPFNYDIDIQLNAQIIPLIEELYDLLNVENVSYGNETTFSTTDVLHKVGLSLDQEIQYLRMKSEIDRAKALKQHLEEFIPHVKRTAEIKSKAALNGHFKNLTPLF